MKLATIFLVIVGLIFVSVGCSKPPAVTVTPPAPTPAAKPPDPTTDTAGAVADSGTPSTPTASPAPTLADVSADVKTEGFKYYGLDNPKPVNLEVARSDAKTVSTGTAIATLKQIKDGKAIFTLQHTGGLSALLGDEDDSAEKDGVYTISSTIANLSSNHTLALPAECTVGKTWNEDTKFTIKDKTATQKTVYKIVGPTKVQTKAATYPDALLVTSSGDILVNDQVRKVSAKIWYVSGKGMVRTEFTISPVKPGEKATTFTIQETK
jgi:hypothetical protein